MPKIRFTFGFFALWASVLTANEYYGGNYPALPIFLLCLAHEGGHIAAARAAKLSPKSITFCASGIRMSLKNGTQSRGLARELLLLFSGCGVNFILALLFYLLRMRMWAAISLGLGVFNLLPLSALDGGRIIRALCEYFSPTSDIVCAQKTCDIIAIAVFGGYFLWRGYTLPLLPLIIMVLSVLEKL